MKRFESTIESPMLFPQSMLDPFAKVLSYAIQNSTIKYSYLTDLCHLCHRSFTRDRDKHSFGRTIVFELIQAIKFKTTLPDTNYLLLLHFVLQVTKQSCTERVIGSVRIVTWNV